jgi:chaperonin GroEL
MRTSLNLLENTSTTLKNVEDINESVKIALGPSGKNGIFCNEKGELTFLTNGSLFLKHLEFESKWANVLKKLLEQAAFKTNSVSGDGSTTTILFCCELLKISLRFLSTGYNNIFLSNGLKKIGFFFIEKVLEFSFCINETSTLYGVLKTSLGKKLNNSILPLLKTSLTKIGRDGLIFVEENNYSQNELEVVQGIELDKGFASSYFVNDLENFQVFYENPYILIASDPINSFNQLSEVITYVKTANRPLVIVAEEIQKEIISTLVLNSIQKKLKVVVIKYSSIKFIKTGILEDLAILTHSVYFPTNIKNTSKTYFPKDLGQAEKVFIQKEKSTFFISKFSKLIAKRKMNELNRELLTSETDYEKSLCKTRIARLSGNIAKIKIGISNHYQIQEERQKIENLFLTIRSCLEEGVLPGAGIFYLSLQDELKQWSFFNLLGEEIFSSLIVNEALSKPFFELCENTNTARYPLLENLREIGYPYGFDFLEQKIVHCFEHGLVDSAKSVRSILWNSLSIIATLITSE